MQAVADLQLLQLAQIAVELGQRVVLGLVDADTDVFVEASGAAQREDFLGQYADAPGVDAGGFVVFVDKLL